MKAIALIIIILSSCLVASCQEPDTIICYSEEDMQMQKDLLQDTIDYFEGIINAFGDVVESNYQIFMKDTLRVEVHDSAGNYIEFEKRGGTIVFNVCDSIGRKIEVNFYPNIVTSEYIYNQYKVVDFGIANYVYGID